MSKGRDSMDDIGNSVIGRNLLGNNDNANVSFFDSLETLGDNKGILGYKVELDKLPLNANPSLSSTKPKLISRKEKDNINYNFSAPTHIC